MNRHLDGNAHAELEKPARALWKRALIVGGVLSALLIGGFGAKGVMEAFSLSPADKPVSNAFAAKAEEVGAKTCTALFSALGETAVGDSQYAASTFWDQKKPNAHSIGALVGQVFGNDTMRGAGVIFAAPVNGRCEGTMVRTVVMPLSCAQVVAQNLPNDAKRQKDLANTAIFQLPQGGKVMMMPAGPTTCVVITTVSVQ